MNCPFCGSAVLHDGDEGRWNCEECGANQYTGDLHDPQDRWPDEDPPLISEDEE